MSSGYYSALSGSVARMHMLDVLSNNLSNVSTPGYKRSMVNFTSFLDGESQARGTEGVNFTFIKGVYPDMSSGSFIETGNPLNLSIMGKGFFKVQGEDEVMYTRQGNFRLDGEGYLITSSGYRVLGDNGPITLDSMDITVNSNGDISSGERIVGRIAVCAFDDMNELERAGDGSFRNAGNALEQEVEYPNIFQGRIEGSNVNVLKEMAQMVSGMRYFESYEKAMKTYSDLAKKANQIGLLT